MDVPLGHLVLELVQHVDHIVGIFNLEQNIVKMAIFALVAKNVLDGVPASFPKTWPIVEKNVHLQHRLNV